MAQLCSICTHPQRAEIDQAILTGTPLRNIAERYSVSTTALHRHKKNGHIEQQLVKAEEAKEIATADQLLADLVSAKERLESLGQSAETAGDLKAAIAAVRESVRIIEITAKMLGELKGEGTTVNVNIIETQFNDFRTAVVGVMCPDCQRRLAEQLRARVGK
jgi:predicted DNA-binding protein YlxM (UPF0122 family)